MNQKAYLTLAAVALFLAICPALSYFRGSENIWFHIAHITLTALIVLKINDWKLDPPKNPSGFLGSLFFIFGAMFLAVIIYSGFYFMIGVTPEYPTALKPGDIPIYEKLSLIENLLVLLVAPVTEEILFRFGLMGFLMRQTNKPLALILSSVIFAEAHFFRAPQGHMPALFTMGLMAGVTYIILGLPWSIALHFMFNFKDILIEQIAGHTHLLRIFQSVLVIGLCFFLIKIFRTIRAFKRSRPSP